MKALKKIYQYSTEDGQILTFIGKEQSGTTTEEIIDILVDRLLAQQEVLPDGFTDRAITMLLRAQAQIVSRNNVRKEGKIVGTDKRTESVIQAFQEAEAEHKRVAEREQK